MKKLPVVASADTPRWIITIERTDRSKTHGEWKLIVKRENFDEVHAWLTANLHFRYTACPYYKECAAELKVYCQVVGNYSRYQSKKLMTSESSLTSSLVSSQQRRKKQRYEMKYESNPAPIPRAITTPPPVNPYSNNYKRALTGTTVQDGPRADGSWPNWNPPQAQQVPTTPSTVSTSQSRKELEEIEAKMYEGMASLTCDVKKRADETKEIREELTAMNKAESRRAMGMMAMQTTIDTLSVSQASLSKVQREQSQTLKQHGKLLYQTQSNVAEILNRLPKPKLSKADKKLKKDENVFAPLYAGSDDDDDDKEDDDDDDEDDVQMLKTDESSDGSSSKRAEWSKK